MNFPRETKFQVYYVKNNIIQSAKAPKEIKATDECIALG